VFGAGGGTSSYQEVEETDVVLLWGSNARAAHPIWFHHLLKGIRHHGTRLYVIDPRRTASAQWADVWCGLNVGTDIALANAMAREILHAGLHHEQFIEHATEGFNAYRAAVESYTLDYAEQVTGVPAEVIREMAHTYARAERAMVCWTLGITEHHNASDNVLALINLSLLTGHVGRWGSGCNPLRGQNNVQGGGDMGALPNKLAGFQDVEDPACRARFEKVWGAPVPAKNGKNLTQMLHAMADGSMRALFCIGENPAQSDADGNHVVETLRGLDHLVVQEIVLTRTAELAHVVLPAAATWCEGEGTVTNSERRIQRVHKAREAPEGAKDELWIISEIGRRMGLDWKTPTAEEVWNEVRATAPHFCGGMSYERLEKLGGIQWPCPDEWHPGSTFLHGRLWEVPRGGRAAPFTVVHHDPAVERPDDEYPFLLTTGRRLESYNTGVQSASYASPLHVGETLDLSPEDADSSGIGEGDMVRVTSRRGSLEVPAHIDPGLRRGLVFMTLHFPDQAATNVLTIDVSDPLSGTAEFKACAVRVEPLGVGSESLAGAGQASVH
jgi:predicted molibdopterin-dependent oxidoreductase YjgC